MDKAIQEFFWNLGWYVSKPTAVCIFWGSIILLLLIVLLIMRSVRNSKRIKQLEQQSKINGNADKDNDNQT